MMDTEDIQGVNALLPQQDYPRASLMGIPLELRQRIFDFFDTSYTVFIENDGSMAFKSEMKPISHICHHLRLETFHFFIPHIILRIDSTDKRMIDVLKWLPVTIQKKIQSIHCNDMDAEIGWYNADIFPSLNEIYYHQDCVQWEVSDRHLNDTTTHDLRSAEFHYEGISEWLDCNRFLHSLHQSLDCEASDPLFVEYFWDDYDVSLDLDISVGFKINVNRMRLSWIRIDKPSHLDSMCEMGPNCNVRSCKYRTEIKAVTQLPSFITHESLLYPEEHDPDMRNYSREIGPPKALGYMRY